MPMETAATSSSRSATQARPSRESRTRRLTKSTMSKMAKTSQYHGRRSSRPNDPEPGNHGASTALIHRLPAGSVMPPPPPKSDEPDRPRAGDPRRVDRADTQVARGERHAAAHPDGLPVDGEDADDL